MFFLTFCSAFDFTICYGKSAMILHICLLMSFSLRVKEPQRVVSNFLEKKNKKKKTSMFQSCCWQLKKVLQWSYIYLFANCLFFLGNKSSTKWRFSFSEKKIPCSNHFICCNNKSIAMILHCIFVCELPFFFFVKRVQQNADWNLRKENSMF